MNILIKLSELSNSARQEVIKEIDVSKQVIAQINKPATTFDDIFFMYIVRMWIALSGVAAVAAIVISIFALQVWASWSQPLAGLLRDATTIIR